MCYFIHLKVVEDGKAANAETFITALSENGLKIEGGYPNFTLMDGMCSCDFVKENAHKISKNEDFFRKILTNKSVKNIWVGWTWGEQQPNDLIRMDVSEFFEKNSKAELQSETWYKLYDPKKYII